MGVFFVYNIKGIFFFPVIYQEIFMVLNFSQIREVLSELRTHFEV